MSGTTPGGIGPQHVGSRVTMRFTLNGGGASEAVGRLLEWPADPTGELVLENRRGEQIRVRVTAITAARVIG